MPRGGPYSQAVVYNGIAYLSGLVGVSKGEQKTFMEQWETIIGRADKILRNLGSELKDHTLKLTAYLSSNEYFPELNNAFQSTFGEGAPARTTVVCAFTLPEVLVELDITACAE
ncbi:hypothetical protein IX51_09710 [uncultured archaeon]|nr:hypothetical protein IX51_09710 [uncultured archaeon]